MPNGGDHFGSVKAGQDGVGFLVNQASRAVGSHLMESIRQFGLDLDQYTVVRHVVREIEAAPDGVTISSLSRNLNLSRSVLESASVKLEASGWLQIERSDEEMLLKPTRLALRQIPTLADASHWVLQGALNGFSSHEIEDLTHYLKRVIRNLDAPLGDDEGPLDA